MKDSSGKGVFCVRAKAEFRGNTFVQHGAFKDHFTQHRCSVDEYDAVRAGWKGDKGGCVLWELRVTEILEQPLYFRPRVGEARLRVMIHVLLFVMLPITIVAGAESQVTHLVTFVGHVSLRSFRHDTNVARISDMTVTS